MYLLGYDIGSSSVKASLVNAETGKCVSSAFFPKTEAAIILSMESVFGTLFSVMILHESITLRMILGCIIILAAVILANSATEETTA